jgi:hypothetical protein
VVVDTPGETVWSTQVTNLASLSTPMNDLFLEHLDRSGFISGREVRSDRVAAAGPAELLDVALAATQAAQAAEYDDKGTIFTQSASLSLGGGRRPCSAINCRLKKAEDLARYALLYSDRVYFNNFLADHVAHAASLTPARFELMRQYFADDLAVIARLRPLIEAGKLIPFTAPGNYCADCLAKMNFGENADKRLRKAYRALLETVLSQTSASAARDGPYYTFLIDGPERLLEHGGAAMTHRRLPKALKEVPTVLARIKAGEKVQLSLTLRKRLGLHERVASDIFRNIIFELATAQSLRTTFLTERSVHLDVLRDVSSDAELERRNHITQRYLTSMVPFASDVELDDLLKLRTREEEAFVEYRAALNQAIALCRRDSNFDEQDARQLYADVLAPRLTALDRKVSKAKRDLVRPYRALGWVGVISFGLYAGFIPPDLKAAATALGLAKLLADGTAALLERSGAKDTIRDDQFYFLWRVRKAARRET